MKQTAWKQIQNFLKDEEGSAAVEYGVLVALIVAVCVGVIYGIGGSVKSSFSKTSEYLVTPATAPK